VDKVSIILNHTFPRQGLPLKNIEATLRMPIKAVIPYEQGTFVDAINFGVPPVWKQPDGPASLGLLELAFYVRQPQHREQHPQKPSNA
jgi:hypothetical protein